MGFLAFCVYIVWTGFMLVNMQVTMGGTTFALPIDVPRYLISLMLPISFLAGTLHLVCQLLEMDPAKVPRGSTVEAMPEDPTSMIGLS
jgi:TRAP-type C4-dicarboxylate transport system permease small subunit